MTERCVRLGLAGLGTVGVGVYRLLEENRELLKQRCGAALRVVGVSARDRGKARGVSLEGVRWYDEAAAMAEADDMDVVVELMGGSDGEALALVERSLERGKAVVTANKALLAKHGVRLAQIAERKGLPLCAEAAVAGGIPIMQGLRESLAANRVHGLEGILNGTCNYILTEMQTTGRDFSEVLAEAQALGYAEADPSFDIDGIDTAHKLSLLTALAFGVEVSFETIHCEGIRSINAVDVAYAAELGYRIKLLGVARRHPDGRIEQRVQPCMVLKEKPIAKVDGVFNGIVLHGDYVGKLVMEGRGAGGHPTASSVVADLLAIARGHTLPFFGIPARELLPQNPYPAQEREGMYYIRLITRDQTGVIAGISAILRDEGVSLEAIIQRGRAGQEDRVPIVFTTHTTKEAALQEALKKIALLPFVLEAPQMLRIESEA